MWKSVMRGQMVSGKIECLLGPSPSKYPLAAFMLGLIAKNWSVSSSFGAKRLLTRMFYLA
jgi:hypothetical protein